MFAPGTWFRYYSAHFCWVYWTRGTDGFWYASDGREDTFDDELLLRDMAEPGWDHTLYQMNEPK